MCVCTCTYTYIMDMYIIIIYAYTTYYILYVIYYVCVLYAYINDIYQNIYIYTHLCVHAHMENTHEEIPEETRGEILRVVYPWSHIECIKPNFPGLELYCCNTCRIWPLRDSENPSTASKPGFPLQAGHPLSYTLTCFKT